MSNKSFSIKENPYMKDIQGGEKKVMKKILSVALSTAMAFSMFASVAFGADAEKLTPEQQFNVLKEAGIVDGFPDGLAHLDQTVTRAQLAKIIVKSLALEEVTGVATYKDKNYTAKHWAAPFIEAATKAGILEGVSTNPANPLFNPTGNVTVQELAKVLVVANKLEVPTEANNTASEWAKGYVAAAIKAGYIAEGINYQANATRAQTVVAAHAIYEFNNFKVTKAEAIDANNVKLTLSTGEVVEVKLEKALEANKATELTYKAKDGRELKYTVTYVVTEATKLESVSADNLKQIVVKFDGELDAETAKNVGNYNVGKTIKSATLSDDKKSVTLLLDGEVFGQNSLANQKEAKLIVNGVKSSLKTKTFKEEVKFTPVDVTVPAIKEVTGLGTSAFKVVFSEPVERASAVSTINYKIDGKSIAGIAEFQSPNTVIISTTLATGDHKLVVSNVRDFSDLKVLPLETAFTVTEDKAAPEVVSAKSIDFTKVEIEFNEPIKSVGKVYNGISSRTAKTVTRDGNKVTIEFDTDKPLTYSENNIVLEAVTDYSNNSSNREVKVTPVPDTERPAVSSVTNEVVNGNHEITVTYSKKVANGTDKANYTLRDKDGKIVVGKGTDANGHPIQAIGEVTANGTTKYVIKLAGVLDTGDYSLDINGVKDTAYVPNTILPYSASLKISNSATPELKKVWVEKADAYQGKQDYYIYATFTKDFAIEGNGSALERAKYNVEFSTTNVEALPSDAQVEAVTPNTVRITVPQATQGKYDPAFSLRVSLISDVDGNFGYKDSGYAGKLAKTTSNSIGVVPGEAKATAKNELTVKFDGALNSINANDFAVTVAGTKHVAKSVKTYSYTNGNTLVTFTFADDTLPANTELTPKVTFGFATNINNSNTTTTDAFGVKVDVTTPVDVTDKIAPKVVDFNSAKKPFELTKTGANTYKAQVRFSEIVTAVPGTGLVKLVVAGPTAITVSSVDIASSGTDLLDVTFETSRDLTSNDVVSISLPSGDATHVVKDANGNAAADFAISDSVSNVFTAAAPAAPSGLTATAQTVAGTNDGKISGVNDTMEYRLASGTWTSVPAGATEISNLAPGSYEVRVKAAGLTPAGAAATIAVNPA
ncbi:S-layer homology domain-containing protein [Paenibacillus turicensis]|uniref:S-layer homology domain-containing protein n=1 Tax=Paenibacillus turicensis TaxID=160487 RepID=UPI003D26A1DF